MRTPGIVRWFDRDTGVGVVMLDDGGSDCIVVRHDQVAVFTNRGANRSAPAHARHVADWRDRWPDFAEAARAGTWGDGGRDY